MDYKKIMQIAFKLGIKPEEFWRLTFIELISICSKNEDFVTREELNNLIDNEV